MQQPAFIFGNYPAAATVVGLNLAAGQTAGDVLQANEDTYVSPAATTLTLTIDLLSPTSIGCFAMSGENLNGITCELRGSTDNFAASSVVVSAAAAVSGFIAAWRSFTPASYRYWRLTVTGATTTTRLYHLALSGLNLLPWLETSDLDKFRVECHHLRSPQGHLLGTQKLRTEKKLSLPFGQIQSAEYALFSIWSLVCVQDPRGFFFIPDTAATVCWFGTTDEGYEFSAPIKLGLYELAPIPFLARMP